MRIPPEKVKPFNTEIAPECAKLIESLKIKGDLAKFAAGLDSITEWCSVFGKTEMGRWATVLDECDSLLEQATELDDNDALGIDRHDTLEQPVISILRFSSLLFENTFSRSIYSSMDRLIGLLDSRKIVIVVQALRLLMVISKSSRFITQHLSGEMRTEIYNRLTAILETWGSKLRGTTFVQFCSDAFVPTAGLYQIQVRPEMAAYQVKLSKTYYESLAELKAFIASTSTDLPKSERIFLGTKMRFIYSMDKRSERFYHIMARLIASSIIFYSRCLLGDDSKLNSLASDHFIEQCCQLLHYEPPSNTMRTLTDSVKTEALKTLASVVFIEKPKKIQLIVDSLDLRNYHGFCPTLLRQCVERLQNGRLEATGDCSIPFVTSLFSLVYHIASHEYGGFALNRSSLVTALLDVVKAHILPDSYISYVTRSVRIIDILTGTDVTEFNAHDGTPAMVNRFNYEVEQSMAHMAQARAQGSPLLCNQQRSALMKSLLNFHKRAVLDVNLAAQMRRIMDDVLPNSLTHIIDNPHYYGSSLIHCAIALTTNFIYQEPAQLTTLQGRGLTDAIMRLIFNEKFPISRDLIAALPNVCSALCLNERGLNEVKSFNGDKPLGKIFNIIFSNKFLLSMRKRKTEILETAHMLGTSFDELIRHHPSLRKEVMATIAALIDRILEQSREEKVVISWSIGKSLLLEENGAKHLPIGDYLAMLGVMLETMLTNRGIHENVLALNECGVPIRLVKLLSESVGPNPVLLNSNYLPNLANILCCVMRQSNRVEEAFIHLVSACIEELNAYASIKDDPQEVLCQTTRLSLLVSTMNNLMKSIVHAQNSYDIRPFLLHHFANDAAAKQFTAALFDTYKLMSCDKLLSAAQQTTTQILEDTTKVQELLRINDADGDALMETDGDESIQTVAAPSTDMHSSTSQPVTPQLHDLAVTSSDAATTAGPSSTTAGTGTTAGDATTERSTQQVAARCQRQIAELIVCIGKNFCNANVTRPRQHRATVQQQQSQQLVPEVLKKDGKQVSKLMFAGLYRLLQACGRNASAPYISQSLNLLKKVLVDDMQSVHLLLPEFYLSGCHQSFFALVEDSFTTSFTKEEYAPVLQSWLNICQKLVSANLLIDPTKQGGGGRNGTAQPQQQQQLRAPVNGFEMKLYLATAQKNAFSAICSLLKVLIKDCSGSGSVTTTMIPLTVDVEAKDKEEEMFKLLEKLLECMRSLLKDMMKLLDLTERTEEMSQEVPVSEIDPRKIQQLVDMGFSQSDALDALLQFSTVPEAAEHLVSQMERNAAARESSPVPPPVLQLAPNPANPLAAGVGSDVADRSTRGEEEPMQGVVDEHPPSSSKTAVEEAPPFSELKPLSREDLQENVDFLCRDIVDSCLGLMPRSRSVVLGLAELITVFADDPLARSWVLDEFIKRLIAELSTTIDQLTTTTNNNPALAEQLAATLHLFNLVWLAFPNQKIYRRIDDNADEDDGEFSMGL